MKTQNLNRLKSEASQQIRMQAYLMYQKGATGDQIATTLHVSRSTVYSWLPSFKEEGRKAVRLKKPGRAKGQGRTLEPGRELEIKKIIKDSTPDQRKLDFALWTRQAVRDLIFQKYQIDMPIRTVGSYLNRWGFTPQKPLRRAYEQNPEAVDKWLKEIYPSIKQRAKEEEAEIQWADETGVISDCQYGRGYAPRGETPNINLNGRRYSVNMISSISNQGKVRFMIFEGNFDSAKFIIFLGRLIKDVTRKLFVILDNSRVHHSKAVQQWLEKHQNKLELFWLPSYSPELNPDEYLNCDLKIGVHSKPPVRTEKKAEATCPWAYAYAAKVSGQGEEIFQTRNNTICP